jgi:hypothetical protein
MKSIPSIALGFALAATPEFGAPPFAARAPAQYPETASVKVPVSSIDHASGLDAQMKAMSDMHERMVNAGTPDERKALMSEHVRIAKDGIAMMSKMMAVGPAGAYPMSPRTMQKQMDMMKMTLHMVMDRMGRPLELETT